MENNSTASIDAGPLDGLCKIYLMKNTVKSHNCGKVLRESQFRIHLRTHTDKNNLMKVLL